MNLESHRVEAGAATERLDVYLASAFSLPRSRIQKLLRSGLVTVNDNPAPRPSYKLRPGDRVSVEEELPQSSYVAAPDLEVVYDDDDIMVVDKPAGLIAHVGAGLRAEASVADFARLHTTDSDPVRPGIVHRLDRDTSGLLIIAKTGEAKSFMQAAFKAHQVKKTYMLH